MEYTVVTLKEKIVVGVGAITSNEDSQMGEIIADLWTKLYQGGVYEAIQNKVNEYAIGLYTDYRDKKYLAMAGNEVSKADNAEFLVKTIPAGRYAKFSVHGPMTEAVSKAWDEIWKMDLDRSFTGDFEEYLNSDCLNCDIDIYIALK